MGIHAIDRVQPPGIDISPMADMDAQPTMVIVTLLAKSSADAARKPCWDIRLQAMRGEISWHRVG
ncbi:hypothetical protein [Dyella silvatica]|uniref:hypothetical protein n=1 Tax=Dyella silvatica TaxID=2992128 RepID=UPI002256DEDA|nr:hypothetical protein [Dyella silvatica]